MKKQAMFLLAALSLTSLPGCAVLAREVFSSPTSPGASDKHDMSHNFRYVHVAGSRDDLQFELPGLDLSVTAKNPVTSVISFGPFLIVPLPVIPYPFAVLELFSSQSRTSSPMWFEVRLSPQKAGFSFDPRLVTLKMDNGEILKPTTFEGPRLGQRYPGRWPCGENWLASAKSGKEAAAVVSLKDFTCFMVGFDTSSSPEREFELSIEGVQQNGEPLPVPSIYLKSGSAWVMYVGP